MAFVPLDPEEDLETVVCAGFCGRRGPQVQLVDDDEDITCANCRDLISRRSGPESGPL